MAGQDWQEGREGDDEGQEIGKQTAGEAPEKEKEELKMEIKTFNKFHLGDNFIHLNWLRAVAKKYPDTKFTHYCLPEYLNALFPMVRDLPNLFLLPIKHEMPDAIDSWRGANSWWYRQPNRADFVAVHLEWFKVLAERMGVESPYVNADSFLCDYPALDTGTIPYFNVLMVNSMPQSGQFRGFSHHEYAPILSRLASKYKVATTYPHPDCTWTTELGLDITGIGNISRGIECIIGTPLGPMWPTFNVWNRTTPRYLLLDEERVNIAPNTKHATNYPDLVKQLEEDGWL